MKTSLILFLLQCTIILVTTEEETKDLDIEDSEDIGRRHRKRKKHHNQNPCSAGYGKTFGQEYTYISAPMINYFFGCPTAPVQLPIAQHYGVFQHGHQGSTHHHGHGHGHGQGSLGQGHFGYGHGNQGYYGQGQFGQSYLVDGGYQQRPLQNVAVSAAAALANYITRPKKVQKQINQFLRPVYNFFSKTASPDMFYSMEQILSNKKEGEDLKERVQLEQYPINKVDHPTTYWDTMLHLFRGNIGSGLLAMGDAFKNGGIIFAPIMTAILGVICVHAQHLLLNCADEMQRLTKMDKPPGFAETVELVFEHGPVKLRRWAKSMRILTDTSLCITQLGFCCVYIVFIANNLKIICDQYSYEMQLSIHMIIVVVPIMLSCMVRNLKYLTPFSTVANIMMAVGVSVVVYKATQKLPSVSSRPGFASFGQLPLYFGTAVYAFEGIGLVLPLKNEMKNPAQFQKPTGVLNVSMAVVGCVFIVVGFFGYLKWGEEVKGSLTLNLEPGDILSSVVQTLIALAIMFTYPLQFYVPVDITWPTLRKKYAKFNPVVKELIYRAVLVLVTFILAESIPQLGLFISLVGAVSSSTLALIIPPLIELVLTSQKSKGISVIIAAKDILIILLGLFVFVTGTFQSIRNIVLAFKLI